MTLDKAIEIITIYTIVKSIHPTEDDRKALKLGIEALKRLGLLRVNYGGLIVAKLSGETKD